MTHAQSIIEAFRNNGNRMTLGYILSHPWGYEFRARATELRKSGFRIDLIRRGKIPSENLYEMQEPKESFSVVESV